MSHHNKASAIYTQVQTLRHNCTHRMSACTQFALPSAQFAFQWPHGMSNCSHFGLPCTHFASQCPHGVFPCVHFISPCTHFGLPCTHFISLCTHFGLPCVHFGLPCTHDVSANAFCIPNPAVPTTDRPAKSIDTTPPQSVRSPYQPNNNQMPSQDQNKRAMVDNGELCDKS